MTLEHIDLDDTINTWIQKLNALVDYLNSAPGSRLIIKSATKPNVDLFFGKMWFDDISNTLKIYDDTVQDFVDWNKFFVPELKFLQKTISNDYIIPADKHAVAVSPEINSGVTVTISDGSILAVL